MKTTPVRRFGWAGVFVLAGVVSAGAADVCKLSLSDVCKKFAPVTQHRCAFHVQQAIAFCRKAARTERFGSHEDHCRATCRAGKQAFELNGLLREFAAATIEDSSLGNETWQRGALAHWQAAGQVTCTAGQFQKAQADCETHCSVTARRRDLDELQALAVGKEFLELQLPTFACPPGPAMQQLSSDALETLVRLYAPGDARRSGVAAE